MNNKRRKKISDVIKNVNKYKTDFEYIKSKLSELKYNINSAKDDVDMILDEETEARDNIPESLQDSEKYWESDQAVTNMEEVVDDMDLDDVISTIDGNIKTINGSIKVNLEEIM